MKGTIHIRLTENNVTGGLLVKDGKIVAAALQYHEQWNGKPFRELLQWWLSSKAAMQIRHESFPFWGLLHKAEPQCDL